MDYFIISLEPLLFTEIRSVYEQCLPQYITENPVALVRFPLNTRTLFFCEISVVMKSLKGRSFSLDCEKAGYGHFNSLWMILTGFNLITNMFVYVTYTYV